jgi:hypothetical protein
VEIQQSDLITFTTYTGYCGSVPASCLVSISTLKAAPYNLAAGSSVYSRITAINAVGPSAVSLASNGALLTAPSTPAAPTTVISGSYVFINWVAPYHGGSTITGYIVEIQQSDLLTYTTYTGYCGTNGVSC